MKKFGLAFLSAAMVVTSLGAAKADDTTPQNCGSMGVQIQTALDNNQQSANYQDALKERGIGRTYCLNGMQKKGLEHYAQALKLLNTNS